MSTQQEQEEDFSLKQYFVPFTTTKAITFIIIIGLIVYCNSLFNGFVFDDFGSIVTNPSIHGLSKILSLFVNQLSGFDANIFYRPLPFIFYTIIYSFSGTNTFFYHLIQLILHIINTLFIFFIFKRFLKVHITFVLSLIYLIHPINQEAVIYVSAMPETLFVFFGLIAFYFLQKSSTNIIDLVFANIALLLSLFSKETGALFIIMALIYVYLFKKQKLLIQVICTFLICAFYMLLRLNANIQHPEIAVVPMMNLHLLERMKSVPEMLSFYIQALLIPIKITHTNSWFIQEITINNFVVPLVFDSIFLTGIIWLFLLIKDNNKTLALFFLCWFLSGLAIHLQIIPIDATVAIRYFYFSFIGLLGLIGLLIQQITVSKLIKHSSIYVLVFLSIFYSIRILITNYDWRVQYNIVVHDQQLTTNDYLQELLYSSELIKLEKYHEAYFYALKATELYPESYYAWNNVGVASYYMGKTEQARKAYTKAITLADYYGTYDNMATLLIEKDTLMNARAFLRKATAKFPNDDKLWGYRIYAEYKTGDLDNAKYAAEHYYLLRKDSKSQYFYNRLQQNLPID